jgi:DNA-directed RNA polymerase specialized sigma24 family protein
MLLDRLLACPRPILAALIGIALSIGAGAGKAAAQITPQTVQLLDRLCAQTLRTNEEDRLYGMISLAVRATIRYRGDEFRPDVIDDAVQDSLDAVIEDCPELTAEDESKRLTMAIEMISDSTTKVLDDFKAAQNLPDKDSPYPKTAPDKLTAADLSEELSSQEIDQWLDSLPPRERALSLFLYSSDVTHKEIAEAVGEPPGGLSHQFSASKNDLMRIFREEWEQPSAPASSPGAGPAMQFTVSGEGLPALMKAKAPVSAAPSDPQATSTAGDPPPPTGAAAADKTDGLVAANDPPPPANAPPGAIVIAGPVVESAGDRRSQARAASAKRPTYNPPAPNAPPPAAANGSSLPSLQVTGISEDLYAGWSLLATAHNLPRGQRVAIPGPFILEPDATGIRRMLVVDIAEIGDPKAATRRFLLKAYAIDGDKDAAGLHDTFHVGAALGNEEAKKTLANASLSSIEVARCLWHDFGTAEDPGLCR